MIPEPVITRLCFMERMLTVTIRRGKTFLTSNQIGKILGIEPATVRKDISYLESIERSSLGYNTVELKEKISNVLGFNKVYSACIIGLGDLGVAFLQNNNIEEENLCIVAGFDENANKVETLRTTVPLFPLYEMEDVIKQKKIDFALLTAMNDTVEKVFERLKATEIKGILNYTGAIFPERSRNGLIIRNIDLVSELKMLAGFYNN